MNVSFGRDQWNKEDFILAYSFRFTETPEFTQREDRIENAVNPEHREGFDNISLLTREKYSAGVRADIRCSFEGKGCPEIILVENAEMCEDGAMRYGACFEVVLYENGVNIWRHYREDGKCSWHKRLGVEFPVTEKAIHELSVEVKENYLVAAVDGKKMTLRVEDIPEKFHIGITTCEGIASVYGMNLE